MSVNREQWSQLFAGALNGCVAVRCFTAVTLVVGATSPVWAAGDHAHEHHDEQAHWMAPADAAKRPNPVSATTNSLARGEQIYLQNCVVCHGAEGEGDGPAGAGLNPPPANLKVMAPQHPDGDLAWKIAEGRGAMPGWKTSLSERDIWSVVNYIKGMSSAKEQSKSEGHHRDGDDHRHK